MEIIVRRTSIMIKDYQTNASLEKSFSVYDKLRHQYTPKGRFYDEESGIMYIPRGINVGWIEHLFEQNSEIDESFDPIDQVNPIMIKYLPRDEVQGKALDFIIGNNDYIANRHKPQLSVNLNTGVGKTYVSIAAASFMCVRTIMITASINWIHQWKDRILEYTDTTKDEIYILTGASSIEKLYSGFHDISKIKFILASHSTLQSYASRYGWEAITDLFKFVKVGLKIYDEAHLNFDNICMIDFFTNTYKTIYLTATPARSDRGENFVYQKYIKCIPKIDLFNADTDPHTKVIALHYNSRPTPMDMQKCMNQYGFNRLAYADYILQSPIFFELLYVLFDMIKHMNKVLIYIAKIDTIEAIYAWIQTYLPYIASDVGIYNSTIPKELKQAQLDKRFILTTTKSCGAAMDIHGLKCTIVLAEPFGSEVLTRQTLGRTRDANTYYIDVVDQGFPSITAYDKKKRSIFRKYATDVVDLYLTDSELHQKANEISVRGRVEYEMYLQELNKQMAEVEVFKRVDKK